jgi:hypothetical protein
MSWQTNIESIIFTITTGDGKKYTPKWKNAARSIEYNASLFEFVNVEGTLALRQKPKGAKHGLEFYFDGENAITDGNKFEVSARNTKPWTVQHPFYGTFVCQPLSLNQDNTQLNCSKFNVDVIETISTVYPVSLPIIEDKISQSVVAANAVQEQLYTSSPAATVKTSKKKTLVNGLDNIFSKIIGVDSELLEFKKLVNNTLVEIEAATADPLAVIRALTALINYPATIEQKINSRINTYEEALNLLFTSFDGTRESKFEFETISGIMIGGILLSSSTNITDDYETRNMVLTIQARIAALYGTLLTRLDGMQTDRADSNTSYIPDYANMSALNEAVNYAVNNLFAIAFEAKQEREYVVDYDTNLILLTHRFYGLDPNDENINKFIRTNNIGLREMLSIPKGRKIIYYV